MRDFPIDRIMTADPATVGPQDSVVEAQRCLQNHFIHHLPVVEGGRLVGMVSSSDLLKLHLLDDKLTLRMQATVGQIMESNVVVINRSATLRDAAEKLSVGGFHALPVIDRKRRLVGMVTSSDLIGVLVSTLDN